MRLTEIGDLARDLAALAPAMRSTIEPLARNSRAAASGVGELNDELDDNAKGSKAAKGALRQLTDGMLNVMRTSVAWSDELQKQLRGGMSAATRSISLYKERAEALKAEATAIATLSGTSKEGAAQIIAGMDSAYKAAGKSLLGLNNRLTKEATELERAALVAQRMSGMGDTSTAAIFKTAMADLQLGENDTLKLLDTIAGASRDFGLNGEKAFATLTENLEDIHKQDVNDRVDYARKLITTAGLMERASFDFKKYAGGLLARDGARGLQDVAMAAAVLGTDQSSVFNLQSRSKNNDLEASKQLAEMVEGMLQKQAPGFSLEQYRKQQSGQLQLNDQGSINQFYESQELASQWLKLIGMDVAGLASMKDAASRVKSLQATPASNESALNPYLKSEDAMKGLFYSTQTTGEAVNKYGGIIAGFFDTLTGKVADLGQMLGLGTTKSGIEGLFREVSGVTGNVGSIGAGAGGAYLLSKLIKSGGLGRLLPGLLGGGAAAVAPAAGAAGAAGGLARLGPIGLAAGYAIGGIATALQSDQGKDRDIQNAQQQGLLRRSLAGVMNPLGQLVLLKRSLSQASDSSAALAEADMRLAKAQALEMEVKRVVKDSASLKQDVKQRGMAPRAEERDREKAADTSQSRSEGLLERIMSGINQTNSLMADFLSATQLGPVSV